MSVGLEEEGLYRVVGVASKVTKLLNSGLDKRKLEKLNLGKSYIVNVHGTPSAVFTVF